jgi:RNA polymerase sigma factor (sigma-70 family)
MRAADKRCGESGQALELLCRTYWYPIYAFARRQGRSHHEAQDLTQEFFSRLLKTQSIDSVHPGKGRFRSFLLASFCHFLANEWKSARRQKRGGGQVAFSLDEADADGRFNQNSADHLTPEKVFERRWAETLLESVLDRLKTEWEGEAADRCFEDLKPFLLGGDEASTFASAALRLKVTEASLKWAVHKLRQRYRAIFREEIAHTVSSPDDIDDEIRHLFSVMAD